MTRLETKLYEALLETIRHASNIPVEQAKKAEDALLAYEHLAERFEP